MRIKSESDDTAVRSMKSQLLTLLPLENGRAEIII